MLSNTKKTAVILWSAVFFVLLDRFLKYEAVIYGLAGINLLGDWLTFRFQPNYYIAFSLPLSGCWLSAAIFLVILCLIYLLFMAWRSGCRTQAFFLLFIILGSASNLFDRLKYGYVVDYLDLQYFTVFNLADAMIAFGALCLIFYKK